MRTRISLVIAALAVACGSDGSGDSDSDSADSGTGDDGPSDPDNFFRATFTLIDGDTFELDVTSDLTFLENLGVCEGVEAPGFGAGVTWEVANPPEPGIYDLAESGLYPSIVVQWPHAEGFRATLAGIGTLELTELGASSGDVIAGTFDGLDMEPEPDEPRDRVQSVDNGEFRCVVP